MVGALTGLRVVEVGGEVTAGYATKLLADLGADVVKVEPPGGDPLRRYSPIPGVEADPIEGGGLFRYLNGAKRAVIADLATATGRDRLCALVADADVVVESLGARALERAQVGPDVLEAANPTLAVVRISDFGQAGPYVDLPTSALTLQAFGGLITSRGVPSRDPVQVGGRIAEHAVGTWAAASALTAVRVARGADQLVVVDLSAMECLVLAHPYFMVMAADMAAVGLPPPSDRHFPLPGIVECRDGWVGVNTLTGQHFVDACSMLEVEEYGDRQAEIANGGPAHDEFFAAIQPWFDKRDAADIVELSQAFRVPAAPVVDAEMMLDFAQFRERPFFVEEDGMILPGPPYRLSVTPAARRGPAPRLPGVDATEEYTGPRVEVPRVTPGSPYAGLRVVELGNFWAAPLCSMYLGALGADVVKVESTRRPDGMRFSGAVPEMGPDWYDRSGVFAATNLNKREVALELNRDEGRALFLELVAGADVVIENFASRVVEQFHLGDDDLRAVKPDLIMVRMPAFGLAGPWRDYVGWAMVIEQATGMATVTGHPDLPMHPGGLVDPVNGMHAAVAVQAGLVHRDRTGEGQLIEVAQLETGANLTADLVIQWSTRGIRLDRSANRDHRVAPQGVYRCQGEGAAAPLVAITVNDDDQWPALAEAVGRADWLADPELRTLEGRRTRHDELDAGLASWCAALPAEVVAASLRTAGIPVARVRGPLDAYADPQLLARGFFQELGHPLSGPRRYPGWPMQFSFLSTHHRSGAPTLGQHNREVLAELGVSDAQLDALEAAGVIGTRLTGN